MVPISTLFFSASSTLGVKLFLALIIGYVLINMLNYYDISFWWEFMIMIMSEGWFDALKNL